MLFRDQFGYFHDVPNERVGWVSPGFGEVVHDGFGNPLGFPLLSLLPLAAQILPSLLGPAGSPSSPPAPAAPPPPPVASSPPSPVQLFAPSPSMSPPQVIVIREPTPERAAFLQPLQPAQIAPRVLLHRRGARRRRTPIRARVERFTEQVSVPPSALPEPVSMATEASGEMNGWYSGPYFGGYY